MKLCRRDFLATLGAGVTTQAWGWQGGAASGLAWSDSKIEEFLLNAKVVKSKMLSTGITNSLRLTLALDGVTQDAHFQSIDEAKSSFQTDKGTELNFRDTWKYNVAAYRMDRLLGLRMTPPSVERSTEGKTGAVTWWLRDAMMEAERTRKKIEPADLDNWNHQMHVVRVFDQLIYNTDRNLQNLLITPDWNIWMIDHTRAFRWHKELKETKNLVRCERRLFARLQALTEDEVRKATAPYLIELEIKGVMARRDKIVDLYRKKIAASSESGVLYDYSRS